MEPDGLSSLAPPPSKGEMPMLLTCPPHKCFGRREFKAETGILQSNLFCAIHESRGVSLVARSRSR
jgi:hypothetical protein